MDTVHLVTKKVLGNTGPRPDVIARTNAHIVYDGPAFALLDYDTKAMPLAVRAELKRLGGFWPALKTVLPALGNLARLERSSTSSGLSRSDTGAVISVVVGDQNSHGVSGVSEVKAVGLFRVRTCA
jgi:hypothetical protein